MELEIRREELIVYKRLQCYLNTIPESLIGELL
nr:MAG TPA: hypothetical protein [Crassvirales sp.]